MLSRLSVLTSTLIGALIVAVMLAGCTSDSSDVTTTLPDETATTAPINSASTAEPAAGVESSAPAPNPDPAAAVAPLASAAGATVVPLADEAPALWTVAADIDGVNVRANPGSASQFLGVYPPGQGGIATTGKRAEVSGVEWKQIHFGEADSIGWVAALFLRSTGAVVADVPVSTAVPAQADSRECYAGGPSGVGYAARLDFTNNGTSFVGGMRVDNGTTVEYWALAASKVPPNPFTVTVRPIGGTDRTEQWTFGIDGIELPGGSALDLASCSEISVVIEEINQQVTAYPAFPGR